MWVLEEPVDDILRELHGRLSALVENGLSLSTESEGEREEKDGATQPSDAGRMTCKKQLGSKRCEPRR